MPIECSVELFPVHQERFHSMDRNLMREVFAMHNSMGRFFNERIYQEELARRCLSCGIEAQREVEIRVSHGVFAKSFFLDLLVGQGCIYELKVADSLSTAHDKQLIHYLLLADLNHGKLVNFRPGSVETRFISTSLNIEERRRFHMDARHWQNHDTQGARLKESLWALLEDWGTFLDADLYREALLHLTSEPGNGLQPVPVVVNGHMIGHQKLCILNPDCAWHLSAIREHFDSYEAHIRRLLSHTSLRVMHWININQRQIVLKTLFK